MYSAVAITSLLEATVVSGMPVVAVGRPNYRMKKALALAPAVVIFDDLHWHHLNTLEANDLDVFDLTATQRYQGLNRIDQYVYNELEFETVHHLRVQETLINLLELASMQAMVQSTLKKI